MAVSSIRAVFLDIDGTLIGPTDRISRPVLNEIERVHRAGCLVALCTGRTRFTADPIAAQLPFSPDYLVASNGAVALNLAAGEVVHRQLLLLDEAQRVVHYLLDAGVTPYVYEDAVQPGLESARVLYPVDMQTGDFAEPPRYRPHANLPSELPFQPVSVATFDDASLLRPLAEKMIIDLAPLAIIQSGSAGHWGIEVFAQGVSKRRGIQELAQTLHLKREEIMAVGDHFNDREMLEWAGIGVAMGNAEPEVKAVADWVTDRVENDGVAAALRRFVPGSEERS